MDFGHWGMLRNDSFITLTKTNLRRSISRPAFKIYIGVSSTSHSPAKLQLEVPSFFSRMSTFHSPQVAVHNNRSPTNFIILTLCSPLHRQGKTQGPKREVLRGTTSPGRRWSQLTMNQMTPLLGYELFALRSNSSHLPLWLPLHCCRRYILIWEHLLRGMSSPGSCGFCSQSAICWPVSLLETTTSKSDYLLNHRLAHCWSISPKREQNVNSIISHHSLTHRTLIALISTLKRFQESNQVKPVRPSSHSKKSPKSPCAALLLLLINLTQGENTPKSLLKSSFFNIAR